MKQITIKLPDEDAELLEHVAAESYDGNRSEAARELLDTGIAVEELEHELSYYLDTAEQCEEITDELQRAESRIEELQNQLRAVNRRNDEHQELVAYVQEEKSLQEWRTKREKARAEAGVVTRVKWWLFGDQISPEERDS